MNDRLLELATRAASLLKKQLVAAYGDEIKLTSSLTARQ
jgi:hypothetical protein